MYMGYDDLSLTDLVFFYGTLMRKFYGMRGIAAFNSEYMADVQVNGAEIYLVSRYYPGFVFSDNRYSIVSGEVHRIDSLKMLNAIDVREGFHEKDDDLYKRKLCSVNSMGRVETAWVYVYNKPVDKRDRILSGNFMEVVVVNGELCTT